MCLINLLCLLNGVVVKLILILSPSLPKLSIPNTEHEYCLLGRRLLTLIVVDLHICVRLAQLTKYSRAGATLSRLHSVQEKRTLVLDIYKGYTELCGWPQGLRSTTKKIILNLDQDERIS